MTQIIDEKSADYLKEMFSARLERPVDLMLYTGQENADAVEFTSNFLTELSALEERITVETRSLDDEARQAGITASPTIVIGRKLGYAIEMQGAPSGHEAGAFVETLALVSGGKSDLSQDSQEKMAAIDQDVLLYSFVTPTCPHCPGSVLQNHKLAIAAPGRVRSVAVSAPENTELSRRFNVSSVPQQIINEDPDSSSLGIQPETAYVDQVLGYGASNADEILAASAARSAETNKLVDDPDSPLTVTDANFREAVAKYPFLVVDCWAEWCGPCRMIAPVIAELAGEQKGRMVFGKLDTENNAVIPTEYDIRSIPTLLVFKNGELADRITGALPKDALLAKLETLL